MEVYSLTEPGAAEAAAVERYRGLLFSVAYRLVGTAHDAEDMVQESFSRWYQLDPDEQAQIQSPRSWLVRVTSRVCLDHLKSARVRRESYVGDWLPEPLPDRLISTDLGAGPTERGDPLYDITLDESVSIALLVLMEELTPAARVTFILHDVFGFSFTDIAEVVSRSPAACRQLAVSARRHVRPDVRRRSVELQDHAAVVRTFKRACASGDVRDLITALAPEVTATVDGGGNARAALRPLVGAEKVARFLVGVTAKQPACELVERQVNGRAGIVMMSGSRAVGVYSFDVTDRRIDNIWVVVNPDKLDVWNT